MLFYTILNKANDQDYKFHELHIFGEFLCTDSENKSHTNLLLQSLMLL